MIARALLCGSTSPPILVVHHFVGVGCTLGGVGQAFAAGTHGIQPTGAEPHMVGI